MSWPDSGLAPVVVGAAPPARIPIAGAAMPPHDRIDRITVAQGAGLIEGR